MKTEGGFYQVPSGGGVGGGGGSLSGKSRGGGLAAILMPGRIPIKDSRNEPKSSQHLTRKAILRAFPKYSFKKKKDTKYLLYEYEIS